MLGEQTSTFFSPAAPAGSSRLLADPVAQVQHPVAPDHDVRVVE
jgi:hypothetical protein